MFRPWTQRLLVHRLSIVKLAAVYATPPISPLAQRYDADLESLGLLIPCGPVMDHHDPTRRQYAQPPYTTQQAQPALAPTSAQYTTSGGSERFRQATFLQDPPSTPTSAIRSGHELQQAYGFPQGVQYGAASAMQTSALQYSQELQTPDSQRQQTQQYQQYGSHGVYGMAQPQSAQSQYDQSPVSYTHLTLPTIYSV